MKFSFLRAKSRVFRNVNVTAVAFCINTSCSLEVCPYSQEPATVFRMKAGDRWFDRNARNFKLGYTSSHPTKQYFHVSVYPSS